MGSRKDIIKRSLGITEYPWSSDDELEAATQAVEETSLRRTPAAEPPTTATVASSLRHQHQPLHQLQQQHQLSQAQEQQQQGSARRIQHRQNRDLFWSIINSPYRIPSSRSRSNEVTPRTSQAAGAGAGGEAARRAARSSADMQRIMDVKWYSRHHGSARSRYLHDYLPVTRVNPGVVVPSEANSSVGISRHVTPRARARAPASSTPATNGRLSPPVPVLMRSWTELRDRDISRAARAADPPVNGHSDEDDINIVPNSPPALPESGQRLSMLEESNEEPDTSLEDAEVTGLGSNGHITLEEEIVAIDLNSTDETAPNPAAGEDETANTSAIAEVLDETDGQFAPDPRPPGAADVSLAGPSGAGGEATTLEPSNRPVKRKRRNSDDSMHMDSIQELNLSLLRLLECPVCLEWMAPPMSQCRRGHLVCGRCRARLSSCPVCRTTFSSVRNRAMENVAELLRYPCRHGCGREVCLRRRSPHEASCFARKYHCPVPLCADMTPLPRPALAMHFKNHHKTMVKFGCQHQFSMKVNSEQHENWLIMALAEFFHLKIDVDIRTWGAVVYVAYIGPKCEARSFTYEVTIEGQHNQRKLVYARTTHSDLESSSLNVSRQDCFHLTLDQALNFLRINNQHSEGDKFLNFNLEISKVDLASLPPDASDS